MEYMVCGRGGGAGGGFRAALEHLFMEYKVGGTQGRGWARGERGARGKRQRGGAFRAALEDLVLGCKDGSGYA